MKNLRAILFDLDGTVTDSGPIIRQTLNSTMISLAKIDNGEATYRKYVGPPLRDTFADLGVASDEIDIYVAEYRRRYDEILDQTTAFPGITEVLESLRAAGFGLAVATSKKEFVAKAVCDSIGLTPYFDVICGASEDEARAEKHHVVEDALQALYERGFLHEPSRVTHPDDSSVHSGVADHEWTTVGRGVHGDDARDDVLMVGDRIFDIEGAAVHGIRTILVGWGDTPDGEAELAWDTASTPSELLRMIASLAGKSQL